MTNTLASPPSIAASVRHRYLAVNANARPTAILSAAFERKNANPSAPQHPSRGTKTGKITLPPITRPASQSESEEADSEPRIKSP
jgi:hypothetical protein